MKMEWKLRVMMAERGISSATELHRRLDAVGVKISSAQLTRVIKEMPARISTELLWGLLNVLDCGPEDLFYVEREGDSSSSARPPVRKAATATVHKLKDKKRDEGGGKSVDEAGDITGPKAIPFPVDLEGDKD